VIRKATEGVCISPRKLNSHVPRDLETIVLKALAHDPRARYVTAGEIRDDLERFLTDRPISARRTNLIERTIRWSRREPTVALLTFATFGLLLALAVVSAVGYLRTKDALDVARSANRSAETSLSQRTEALTVADQQRVRAEKNLQVALNAFDEIMQNIGDRGIEADAEFLGEVTDTTSPNVTPEDAKLLQSLLGFFDDLAANNSAELLAESAVAARRAGDIYLRLGQLRQADRAYSEALQRHRRLSSQNPDNLSSTVAQAEIMNELAVINGLRGELGRADQMFHQTRTLLKASAAAMASPAGQFEYARALRLFASLAARTGLDGVVGPQFDNRAQRRPIGVMMKLRTEDELSACAEAIDILGSLIDQSPDEIRYRAELARAYRDKAKVASKAKMRAESESAVKQSIEQFEQLLSENKDSEAIRYELAMTLSSTEAFSFNQIVRAGRANELSAELLAGSPDLPRYQALRAHTLETLAAHQQRVNRLDPAEQNLLEALKIYNTLTRDSPELSLYQTRRSQTLESIADLKLRKGDSKAAIEYLERAIRQLQPRMRRNDISPVARMQMQRMRQKLARIQD
jgi:tetratricopeptide (TPR) repeat protein